MLCVDQLRFAHPDDIAGAAESWQFSLSLARGELGCIGGPSGGGKSTLLQLIAGLLTPDAGALRWDDTDLLALPAGRRPVSILFQQVNLFDSLSALDNALLGVDRRSGRATRAAALTVLEQLGVAGLADRRSETLSGGQQQRVALARALLRQTPLILLDEPFAALDADNRAQARGPFESLAREHGCAVLMVSHDAADAAGADHRWWLDGGRLNDWPADAP